MQQIQVECREKTHENTKTQKRPRGTENHLRRTNQNTQYDHRITHNNNK